MSIEAMKAIQMVYANTTKHDWPDDIWNAICQAVEAEKQEPVAWLHWLHGPVRVFVNKDIAMAELDRLNQEYPVDKDDRQMLPLYTHPQPKRQCDMGVMCIECPDAQPKREWVGLTELEETGILLSSNTTYSAMKFTEAKLKEKNT